MIIEHDGTADRQWLAASVVERRQRVLHLGRDRERLAVVVLRLVERVVEQDLALGAILPLVAVFRVPPAEQPVVIPVGLDPVPHPVEVAEEGIRLGPRHQVKDRPPVPLAHFRHLEIGPAGVNHAVLHGEAQRLTRPHRVGGRGQRLENPGTRPADPRDQVGVHGIGGGDGGVGNR